jgi:hypothetical protein
MKYPQLRHAVHLSYLTMYLLLSIQRMFDRDKKENEGMKKISSAVIHANC